MLKETLRPAWVEIDLRNLAYNMKQIRTRVGGREIIGVVKADAYGHGSVEVSRVLLENGAAALAIATLNEAIVLRKAGFSCPIIMLGLTPALYADTLLEYDITPVTASLTNAAGLSEAAGRVNRVLDVLIAVDTGMGRIGLRPGPESVQEVVSITALPHLRLAGLFSHFATADEGDKTYALGQMDKFNAFYAALAKAGVAVPKKLLSNSAATMELPAAWFDAVRPGIMLYGCYPSDQVDREAFPLRPVMSVKANIVQLKKLPPGCSVSYGRKFVTERESLIGTLTLGYADGYPRFLSGKGRAIVRGQFAPIAGNICMDQCMIDVTDVPGVQEGDEVVLLGSQGDKTILADEIATHTGTINYEVVCGLGQRLPKVYLR